MTTDLRRGRDYAVEDGDVFRSRSGREWRALGGIDPWGRVRLLPLGSDTRGGGGGVKSRAVEAARLLNGTHGWRRVA